MTDSPKKSKFPDFDELTGIAGKLFTDLKKSVDQIVTEYKDKRTETEETPAAKPKAAAKKEKTTSVKQKTDEKDAKKE